MGSTEHNDDSRLDFSEDHPFARELASLRAAVSHYERTSQTSALQSQRQAFDLAAAHETIRNMTQRNGALELEVETLRGEPIDTSEAREAENRVAEANLAVRRAGERLGATEALLLSRSKTIEELNSSLFELTAAHAARGKQLGRSLEAQALAQQGEREARLALRQAVEERDMSDNVVLEYAELVREIEGRASTSAFTHPLPPSSAPNGHANGGRPLDFMIEGRQGLQRLTLEMSTETNHLHAVMHDLHTQLDDANVALEAAKGDANDIRGKLAEAQVEILRQRADDSAAARLVSHYMEFSQSSTNVLQTALARTKSRHAATLTTLTSRTNQAERALDSARIDSDRLRRALDDATQDISRETYGRRREISLRVGLLVREERVAEELSRWVRRAREISQSDGGALAAAISGASRILASLDSDQEVPHPDKGSAGRIALAQETLALMQVELQNETEAKLGIMRKLAVQGLAHEACSNSNPRKSVEEPISTAILPVDAVLPTLTEVGIREQTSTKEQSVDVEVLSPLASSGAVPQIYSASETEWMASPKPTFDIPHQHAELLSQLETVPARYDSIQRRYRACLRALASLAKDVVQPATIPITDKGNILPLLKVAVDRLDDVAQDAIVEIEIRAADDARLAQGYRTLLTVQQVDTSGGNAGPLLISSKAVAEATAFANGEERLNEIQKSFELKLDDLLHDIAAVKSTLHQLSFESDVGAGITEASQNESGWSQWASELLSSSASVGTSKTPPSRPSSPNPQSFGSVMTSTKLRAPSRISGQKLLAHNASVLAQLDFRISMPFTIPSQFTPGVAEPQVLAPWARPRTVSLAARSTSDLIGIRASTSRLDLPRSVSMQSPMSTSKSRSSIRETEMDSDTSDVE